MHEAGSPNWHNKHDPPAWSCYRPLGIYGQFYFVELRLYPVLVASVEV